jgi:dCTP deaminase
MILPDREIQLALGSGHIIIDPPPSPKAYSSTSVDLTLAPRIHRWKEYGVSGEPPIISPAGSGFVFDRVRDEHTHALSIPAHGYILAPGAFIFGWTRETVSLPIASRVAARVEGKSSLARCGVGIHITAPTIHSGFKGQIQLEMFNHSTLRVKLVPGMRVCQLIFEMCLGTPQKGYEGMFAGQSASAMKKKNKK